MVKKVAMAAGYSGTPLIKKLGITPSMRVLLINAPADYFNWLHTNIHPQLATAGETPHFVHAFITSMADYKTIFKKLILVYKANPTVIIWISWYKKSAGMVTDVTENSIRQYALQHDLVDVKVCAVSDQWSALKFVVRKELRKQGEEPLAPR